MSRKDDDSFWTIMALCWLMQDEEEDKPVDTSGCFPMILFTVFMIGGLSDNLYCKCASMAVLAYFLWTHFRRFSKFFAKCILGIFFSALAGCLLQSIFGSQLISLNSIFGLIIYSASFMFFFIIVCPWLTKKLEKF